MCTRGRRKHASELHACRMSVRVRHPCLPACLPTTACSLGARESAAVESTKPTAACVRAHAACRIAGHACSRKRSMIDYCLGSESCMGRGKYKLSTVARLSTSEYENEYDATSSILTVRTARSDDRDGRIQSARALRARFSTYCTT
jgi:hypothetical protein